MYNFFDVWRRIDGKSAVRYRCFRSQTKGLICVQNVDTIRLPLDPKYLASLEHLFLELFIEQAPEERAKGWSVTVEEAIKKFDKAFSDSDSESDEAETND